MAKKKIELEFTIDGKKAKVTVDKFEGAVESLTRNTKTAGAALGNVGNIMTGINSAMAIGGRAISGISSVLAKYTEFESGLANVNTILNVSNEELEKYGDQLLEISSDVGKTGKDLTDALYQAASAGVAAGDAIDFVEVAAKAATAGLSTTETAVDGITTVLNAFHMESSKAANVSDVMFQTVKLGKTTFDELSASLSQVAPLAASSGISFEEISAGLATLTKQGVPTAQAVTQIRSSIISANDALGDGWSDTMTYQEGMVAIAESADGSKTKLKETVGRVEAMNAVLTLTGENAAMAASDLDAMTGSVGAMNAAFAIQSDTIEFKMNKLSATLDNVGISFIDSFADPMSSLLDNIDTGIKGLGILFGTKDVDNFAGAAERMAGFAESLLGTTEEYRLEQQEILSYQWDMIEAKIISEELSGDELDQANAQLESLKEQSKVLDEFVEKKKELTISGGAVAGAAPARPSIEIEADEEALMEEADALAEEWFQKELERVQKLRDIKADIFLTEQEERELEQFEIETAAMNEMQLNDQLLKQEIEQQKILKKIRDASTKEEIKRLEREKEVVDAKIGLIKSEGAASEEKDKLITSGSQSSYNSQLSLVDNIRSMVQKKIKAFVAEGVTGYVASVLGSSGIAGIFLAPLAHMAASALMESVIPSFAGGGRGISGGLSLVGEEGPELINAPGGSDIFTKPDTTLLLDRILAGGSAGGVDSSGSIVAAIQEQTARLAALEKVFPFSEFDERYKSYQIKQIEIGAD